MNFNVPVLETKRLILRPVSVNDYQDMFDYASDQKNIGILFKAHESLEETKKVIEELFLKRPEKNQYESWAIVLKESNQMIGTIDYHHFDKRKAEAEVGYILNKQYWNQGYTTEALKKVVEFGFKTINLQTIYARCRPLNHASNKVVTKAGFEFEEVLYDNNQEIEFILYKKENKNWRNTHGKKSR